MASDRVVRAALWLSVALNLFGVLLFLGPAVGRPSSLIPLEPPAFYAAPLVWVIGLFAFAYGWLAVQPAIDRPLLAVGATGRRRRSTVTTGMSRLNHQRPLRCRGRLPRATHRMTATNSAANRH